MLALTSGRPRRVRVLHGQHPVTEGQSSLWSLSTRRQRHLSLILGSQGARKHSGEIHRETLRQVSNILFIDFDITLGCELD